MKVTTLVGVNFWRTTGDIQPDFDRMSLIGPEQAGLAKYAGPRHWNDPDMLEVGNGKLTVRRFLSEVTFLSMPAN